MFDCSKKLQKFYDDHVKPSQELRNQLAGNRDANIDRLKRGLNILREQGKLAGPYLKDLDQGSYAMDLLIQQRNDDYDLDEGIIFDADTIPSSPLEARKRVLDAIVAVGGNFSKPPEVRTNAVTVWYANGHHIDMAVYRRRRSFLSETIEHASTDWIPRDPQAVEDWFRRAVGTSEPSSFFGKNVAPGQLRRIVRLVKAIARSRSSWDLPGGMILTTLVVEVFRATAQRDDVALRDTLRALRTRLAQNLQVKSPIAIEWLTTKPKFAAQVQRLSARLNDLVPRLDVLERRDCTAEAACRAWGFLFKHEYWPGQATAEQDASQNLGIEIKVARKRGHEPFKKYDGYPLQKDLWLRFALAKPERFQGCDVRWTVENRGDEAREANDLGHEVLGQPEAPAWEHTAYKGSHTMRCEVLRNRQVVAHAKRVVLIGSR